MVSDYFAVKPILVQTKNEMTFFDRNGPLCKSCPSLCEPAPVYSSGLFLVTWIVLGSLFLVRSFQGMASHFMAGVKADLRSDETEHPEAKDILNS